MNLGPKNRSFGDFSDNLLTGWQRAAYAYPAWGGYCWGMPHTGAPLPYGVPYWPTKEQEIDDIQKDQAEYLEDTLSEINKHIQELEAKKQYKK